MKTLKKLSIIAVFLMALNCARYSEGAQPACGACAAAAGAGAAAVREAVYTTPIHVTLEQDGNRYKYYSTSKSTIFFTGKRGEEIAIGGRVAKVNNIKELKGRGLVWLEPNQKVDDVIYDVVTIQYE